MNEKIEMLHKICKALMEELEDYSKKIEKSDGMSAGDLEAVDKLSHALKSVKTTIAMMEASDEDNGYSEHYMPYWGGISYADGNRGGSRGGQGGNSNTMGGNSYARGGRRGMVNNPTGRNQYSRENNYSYADEFQDALKEALNSAPNEHVREKLQRIMDDM